jgi:glycosyltransferase involved in cell wall biosynthesis
LAFVLPGNLDGLTGGTIYDRRMVDGLRDLGWQVDVVSLATSFPWPDAQALDDAEATIAALPDGTLVVADGLALGAMPAIALRHARRLRWVALVHHPLALETGLSETQRQQLHDSERQALTAARVVIVTSKPTARALGDYGVPLSKVRVVEPGTTPAALAVGTQGRDPGQPMSLLCVATLTPRKGHALLIEALAALQDRRWTLHCVGSTTRDAATTSSLQASIAAHGLEHCVQLHGEFHAEALEAFYASADAFVLPSLYEGYGMALAEALAHGLPIVSTTGGAIPHTVPANAGLLVPPGDATALRIALARLLDEPACLAELAAGARAVRLQLNDWPAAVERFAAALTELESVTATTAATATGAASATTSTAASAREIPP